MIKYLYIHFTANNNDKGKIIFDKKIFSFLSKHPDIVNINVAYEDVDLSFVDTLELVNTVIGNDPIKSVESVEPASFNIETTEKSLILKALEITNFVQVDAAKLLGLSKRTLNYKISRFKITHPSWRKNKKIPMALISHK